MLDLTTENALSHRVIGAAIEVHRILGPGLLEKLYEEALCIELALRAIPFERQEPVPVTYKGHTLRGQRVDLRVASTIVVEVKAVEQVPPITDAIVLSYLRWTGCRVGLIINFNCYRLVDGVKRIALTKGARVP